MGDVEQNLLNFMPYNCPPPKKKKIIGAWRRHCFLFKLPAKITLLKFYLIDGFETD